MKGLPFGLNGSPFTFNDRLAAPEKLSTVAAVTFLQPQNTPPVKSSAFPEGRFYKCLDSLKLL